MILKYRIYKELSFDKSKDIETLQTDKITYQGDICIHSLVKLYRTLSKISSYDLPINARNLSGWGWDVKCRYETKAMTEGEIRAFYDIAKDTFGKLYN